MSFRAITVAATLVLGISCASFARPAQQHRIAHIGIIAFVACPDQDPFLLAAFAEFGYVTGKTAEFDCILARGIDGLPEIAAELVRRNVDVILVGGTPGIIAAQHATRTIPIVMWDSGDAVREGLVESLAHPGGNTTGNTDITIELLGKRIELLREVVPNLKRMTVLSGRSALGSKFMTLFMKDMEEFAGTAGIAVTVVAPAGGDPNAALTDAFSTIARDRPDALYVIEGPFARANAKAIGDLARAHRIPTITGGVVIAREGALMGYGVDEDDLSRRAVVYIDKILHGVRPEELPVQQSTKFNLIINAATAAALGLTIPPMVVARADEVIE